MRPGQASERDATSRRGAPGGGPPRPRGGGGKKPPPGPARGPTGARPRPTGPDTPTVRAQIKLTASC